jgi:hypothetical protein
MSDLPVNTIALNFLNIHRIITRVLRVSLESIQGDIQRGVHGAWGRQGLLDYLRALTSVLNAHHLAEDDLVFPFFKPKFPNDPFASLTEWHHKMVLLLETIDQAVEKCAHGEGMAPEFRHIEEALVTLNDWWPAHIGFETDEFINKADALVTADEALGLVRQMAEFSQRLALPPELTVAFALYNLSPEDRWIFSQGMPPEVLQHLVPVVWKPKWEAMKPLLLE